MILLLKKNLKKKKEKKKNPSDKTKQHNQNSGDIFQGSLLPYMGNRPVAYTVCDGEYKCLISLCISWVGTVQHMHKGLSWVREKKDDAVPDCLAVGLWIIYSSKEEDTGGILR